jgi:two-component system cell cycle sensor histidine kinase PleC
VLTDPRPHDVAQPGASARSMRWVFAGMVALLVAALITSAALERSERRHIRMLISHTEDHAAWAVNQLALEQQRLELALLRARDGAAEALQEAGLRYETFASRHDILSRGIFHRLVRDLPAYHALTRDFEKFLSENDPLVADGVQPADVEPLLAAAAAMRKPTYDLVLAENAMLNELQSRSREHLAAAESTSFAAMTLIGLVVLCFAAYGLAVLRRAQNSEVALSRSQHVLRDALLEAQSANAAKSTFLANMSHELRTPLNAVIGFSEFLEVSAADKLDERQRGYLADIRASGRHLLEILSSILELSKLEAGKIDLKLGQVGVSGVIEECLRMVSRDAGQKGIALKSGRLDALPPVQGDATRLRQVFLNLLTNALKYSSEGGRVRVSGATDGSFVIVRISDEGIGMRSTDIATALRPFERLRTPQTANQEGVGLGLSIVKTLVDAHGGELAIESEIGRGTTVTVRLPMAAADAAVQRPAPAAADPRGLKLAAAR